MYADFYRLAGICRQVVNPRHPLLVRHGFVVARRNDGEIFRRRLVGKGDAHLEAFAIFVGSLCHKAYHVIDADGYCRRNQPIVVGVAGFGARKADILTAAIGAEHFVLVPPRRVDGHRVDDLCILQRAAVQVTAKQRCCRLTVAVDTRPFAELYRPVGITLEIVEKCRLFFIPSQQSVVATRIGIVYDCRIERKRLAYRFRQRYVFRIVAHDVERLFVGVQSVFFYNEFVISAIHFDYTST